MAWGRLTDWFYIPSIREGATYSDNLAACHRYPESTVLRVETVLTTYSMSIRIMTSHRKQNRARQNSAGIRTQGPAFELLEAKHMLAAVLKDGRRRF